MIASYTLITYDALDITIYTELLKYFAGNLHASKLLIAISGIHSQINLI